MQKRSLLLRGIIVMVMMFLFTTGIGAAQDDDGGDDETPHWSYEGEEGPDHWGDLSEDFALCASGEAQSPIDVSNEIVEPADLGEIGFNYQPTPLNIVNNGHAIQVDYEAGSSIDLDGTTYNLDQFHFHAPSEHTGQGENLPMELHLVHSDADGNLAVIGVLIEAGEEDNAAFGPIWNSLPAIASERRTIPAVEINAADLLPANPQRYLRYMGSLTTPPCSEDVQWILMGETVKLSQAQIDRFTAIYDGNNRPVQPLNGRTVQINQPGE